MTTPDTISTTQVPARENVYATDTGEILKLVRGKVVRSKHDGSEWLVLAAGDDDLFQTVTLEIIEPGLTGKDTLTFQAVREMFEITCLTCRDAYPVDHMGSSMCRSGSPRSGGSRPHCTCDACW